jgi:hypothetical protein
MPSVKGAATHLLWYLQADYETLNTTSADARPIQVRPGLTLAEDIEEHDSELFAVSTIGFSTDTYKGLVEVSGDFETNVGFSSWGCILYAALGAQSTTPDTPSAGNHTHLYEPADVLPSYTVIKQVGGSFEDTFVGVKVNTLSIASTPGKRLTMKAGLMGRSAETRKVAGLTVETLATPTYVHDKHLSGSGTISWNGTDYCIQSWTLDLNNQLERTNCSGSDYSDEPEQGEAARTAIISCTGKFKDQTLYNAEKNETAANLDLDFATGDLAFKVHLDDARVTNYDEKIDRNGALSLSWEFRAQVLTTADKGITFTVINTQTSAIA